MLPIHETDPNASKARTRIITGFCIHCGLRYKNGERISYTELSNKRVIWWHTTHIISDYDD